jgi:hypothetical protein
MLKRHVSPLTQCYKIKRYVAVPPSFRPQRSEWRNLLRLSYSKISPQGRNDDQPNFMKG